MFQYVLSVEVPDSFVMVESQTISTAILSQDSHDVCLLFGREFVVAVMIAVIRPAATTEVTPDTMACLGPTIVWHVIIDMREAPCFLHLFDFIVAQALAALPCVRIDGRAA